MSKSHLCSSYLDEEVYGCPFCVQEGHTTEEGDATVFFSRKQFFAHLARHPRPLPRVQGIIVAEGKEIHPALRDNYDVWFPNPPAPSATASLAAELLKLPTGTAIEAFRPLNGLFRLAPDSARPLQFAAKARIVGIEFPAKYTGEWAMAWADNERGPIPMYAVRLDPPPRAQIKKQGASSLSAVARWRWHPNDKVSGDWLRFSKGDVITNIGCA